MGKKSQKLPYKYNLKKSKMNSNDLFFHEQIDKTIPIPSSTDLRSGYSCIKDQMSLGACTAFSACSVLEFLLGKDIDLSELYFYFQERKEDGDITDDGGSTIERSAEVAISIGTCKQELYPYILANFAVTPNVECDTDAKNHKVAVKYQVKTINDILYSIGVLKKPILIGIDVYESLEEIGSDGFVPMPKRNEQMLGKHAVNLCGYFWKNKPKELGLIDEIETILDVEDKYKGLYFICRNSWSDTFGDKGYMYLSSEFMQKYSSDWFHIDIK